MPRPSYVNDGDGFAGQLVSMLRRITALELRAGGGGGGSGGGSTPAPSPPGTFIMGGWATAPTGTLLLDGSTITDGATAHPELAQAIPAWVSGADLVLPNAADATLMALTTGAGTVAGSMTRTLTAAQLPAHHHTVPKHLHKIDHNHPAGHTSTDGGHHHDANFLTTATGSGNNGDLARPYNASHTFTRQVSITDGKHRHAYNLPNFAGNSSEHPATATGDTGSGTPLDITPRHLGVRVAVWT